MIVKRILAASLVGTPALIIDKVQSFGGVDLTKFQKAVARARREAAKKS